MNSEQVAIIIIIWLDILLAIIIFFLFFCVCWSSLIQNTILLIAAPMCFHFS